MVLLARHVRLPQCSGAMTALSGAPAPVRNVHETPSLDKKKKGIDYSKFDNIEDSDDEKPQVSKTSATAEKKPAEQPHCHNCHKHIKQMLRCGVCKKAEYCSAQCQKDDWRFHKRVCKKPEEPKAPSKPPDTKPPPASQKNDGKRKETETVVEKDEELTWYRHRDWKPTNEPKKDFAPTQITNDAASTAVTEASKPVVGSAWNAAGTWEDKDVTDFAKKTLKEKLIDLPSVDVAGGTLSSTEVGAVDGEASKPVIRGRRRHMFDLSFKVKFDFKWMGSAGQSKVEGHVNVSDFTNDTFAEGVLSEPVIELTFKDGAKTLDAGRRKAVEAALGANIWPPPSGSFMAHVAAKMETWAQDYQAET